MDKGAWAMRRRAAGEGLRLGRPVLLASAPSTATSSTTTRSSTSTPTACGCTPTAAPRTAATAKSPTTSSAPRAAANLLKNRIEGETELAVRGPQAATCTTWSTRPCSTSIRSGKPINNGRLHGLAARCSAILGQMVCYTGQQITWDEAMKLQLHGWARDVQLGHGAARQAGRRRHLPGPHPGHDEVDVVPDANTKVFGIDNHHRRMSCTSTTWLLRMPVGSPQPSRFFGGRRCFGCGLQMGLLESVSTLVADEPKPESKPKVRVVFIRPKDQAKYWMSWPGNDYNADERQAKFTEILTKIAQELGIQLEVDPAALEDADTVDAALARIKQSPPDGIMVIQMHLSYWREATDRFLENRGDIPTIVFSQLGTSFTGHLQIARKLPKVYVAATDGLDWLSYGMRMFKTIEDMKNSRLCIITGDKTYDRKLDVIGTTLHYIPLDRWVYRIQQGRNDGRDACVGRILHQTGEGGPRAETGGHPQRRQELFRRQTNHGRRSVATAYRSIASIWSGITGSRVLLASPGRS